MPRSRATALAYRDSLCASGDFCGSTRVPGLGDLLHVASNLRDVLAAWETRDGGSATGLLGPVVKLMGLTQMKMHADKRVRSPCLCVCVHVRVCGLIQGKARAAQAL